jgi:hypothetical protein
MTFPLVEAKIASIRREAAEPRTTVLVRLYRVDDGGLDAQGQQVYTRTLRRSRLIKHLGVIASNAEIVVAVRARVLEWLDDLGITISKDRLVCSL